MLLEESGDAFPRTPWDFSLWACTGSTSPGLVGRQQAATSCPLQGRIGARGASPQCSILRCDLETLSWVELNINYLFRLCCILAGRLGRPCAPVAGVAGH